MVSKVAMPPEVAKYYANGKRKAVSAIAQSDSDIVVTYDDGQKRLYHMYDLMRKPFFAPLQDPSVFARVYVDAMGAIVWDVDQGVDSDMDGDNRIDLSPDTVYIYGVPADDSVR